MPTYSKTVSIPSCHVKKEMLEWLENFILQKASDFAAGNDAAHQRYSVNMVDDSGGSLEVRSVDELPLDMMPNDIKNVTLKVSIILDLQTVFYAKICFDTGAQSFPPSGSYHEIQITGHTARETADGISEQIRRTIDHSRFKNLVRKPSLRGSAYH